MRVRWLRKALRDLDDEATYIATDDPVAARLVVERVLQLLNDSRNSPASIAQGAYRGHGSLSF